MLGSMISFVHWLHEFCSRQDDGIWEHSKWDAPFIPFESSVYVVSLETLG